MRVIALCSNAPDENTHESSETLCSCFEVHQRVTNCALVATSKLELQRQLNLGQPAWGGQNNNN